ncbi:peptidase S8/S53 domain-containing protein [Dissophora ornata]|nr:peptidase S8/S53 domain-containing protein [Dissophora ornata]
MKVACLLPLPLLLVPFTHATDYLVRFKEGSAANIQLAGVSRIQTDGAHPKFDYKAGELTLSISQAKALAGHNRRHGKSKAQVEALNTFDENDSNTTTPLATTGTEPLQIKSKGRWLTFDDDEFHVWHGDFSDEEAEMLASDAGVDLVEKDIEIRFPELEDYNNKVAMANKVQRLERALDVIGEQMDLHAQKADQKIEGEVQIPGSEDSQLHNDNGISKKVHEVKEYVSPVSAKDSFGPNNAYTVQRSAPSWGLPRVSQRHLPLSTDYNYPNSAGQGVDVYIIDTGININHVDFEGRAHWGTTTVPGAPNTDDNGHGTFVAGVVGSHTFGVAKKANLIAVKGLNKDGTSTLSQILAALDWVIKQNSLSSNHRNVVNLSLGAGYSKVLNSAVDTLVQSGMFIVAAAGNGNERNVGQDACNYSPASASMAFTVGSTNINDQMSGFSNYGKCVNIYAPGERVRSTWIGPTNREVYTDSGTSFSAPSVAGIAALIMGAEQGDRSDGSWSPRSLGNRILQLGTHNVVKNFKGPSETNLLAFNGVGIIGVSSSGDSNGNGGGTAGTSGDNGNNTGDSANGDGNNGPTAPIPSNDVTGPHYISGSPSVSSISTNHGPTLTVIQALTILSTVGSTLTFIAASL